MGSMFTKRVAWLVTHRDIKVKLELHNFSTEPSMMSTWISGPQSEPGDPRLVFCKTAFDGGRDSRCILLLLSSRYPNKPHEQDTIKLRRLSAYLDGIERSWTQHVASVIVKTQCVQKEDGG